MKLLLQVSLLLLLAPLTHAQSQSGAATTAGPCSPANTGDNNTFVINCGISKEQGTQIISIANRILADQLNAADVMAKLDEILRDMKNQRVVVNAPGSMPIIDNHGTVNGAVIFNGAPPAKINYTEEVTQPLSDGNEKIMTLHITTDRHLPGAVIGILFSGPFELASRPDLKNAYARQIGTGKLARGTPPTPIPNTLVISINIPAAFDPGQELIVSVRSKTDIHVVQAASVIPRAN